MGLITVQDIVNSCQHTQGFFQRALNLEDMEVGAWICILDTCIIIFLVQYSWFRLFCYGYFVIGYLFGFCCIAELICNKMWSSEFNFYYSEMQLELSEIDLTYLKFIWKLLKLIWIIWNSLGNFWNWPEKGVDVTLNSGDVTLRNKTLRFVIRRYAT